MAKRQKQVVATGLTMTQVEEAFGQYALADAKIQGINSAMDEEFTRIREENCEELSKWQDAKDKAFALMQTYAIQNRETLFSKRKSQETSHGVFGFRTGTPKLKCRKGFTWAASLELVKRFAPDYIRMTEDVAKDRLLADRDKKKVKEIFANVGIQVVQDETFFVEPKKEE